MVAPPVFKIKFKLINRHVMLALLLLGVYGASGQFTRYGPKEGLSQSSVYGILQDKKGFLWIATADGLNRFDGYEFKRLDEFAKGTNIPYSIDGAILEGDDGNIWLSGKTGVFVYDRLKNTVRSQNFIFKAHPPIYTVKIIGRKDNTFWFVVDYRVLVSYNTRSGKVGTFNLNLPTGESVITGLVLTNQLILCTHAGVRTFDIVTGKMSDLKLNKRIRIDVAVHHQGNKYYIAGDGLYTWDIVTNSLEPVGKNLPESVSNFYDLIEHDDQLYLAAYGHGLIHYDLKKEKIIKFYKHSKTNPTSISFDFVRKLFIDKTNQLWVGTDGAGINKLDLNPEKFKLYRSGYNGCPVFSSDFVKCFYKDNSGKIWFGTLSFGLNVYDREHETVKIYNSSNSNLPGDIIISIFKDSKGRIWILTDMGVCYTNDELSYFRRVKIDNFQFEKGAIYLFHIIELDDGSIVIASENGFVALDEKQKSFYWCTSYGTAPIIFVQDTKTTLLGTDYDGNTGQFAIKRTNGKLVLNQTKKILDNTKIRSYLRVGESLFAASERGLIEFRNNYKTITYYGKQQGLNNLFLYGLLPDKKGNLWVSSNLGVSKFDTSKHLFYNYTVEDNLQSAEFNTNAYYRSADGEYFFGGIDGFNSFNPNLFFINAIKTPLNLTAIKLNGKSLVVDSVLQSGKIKFSHTQNNIELTFSLLDFISPSQVNYFYKVSGVASRWLSLGNSRKISLSNLAPGHYDVWVKAINNDGIQMPTVKLLSFTIIAPWYKTWWFITIIVILVLGITSLIIRYLSRHKLEIQLAENQKEKEVLQIKQNISRDLHDHLGANLSRLSLLTQRLAKTENLKKDNDNFRNISTLTTEMNKQINELVWSVNTEYDNLESLLSYIRGYASTFLEEIDIPFKIEFDYPDIMVKLNPIAKQTLFSVTREALNNLAKYSKATLVTLTFKLKDNEYFTYTIQDNGVGFDLNKSTQLSNGLKNMRARCKEAGFDFTIETAPGKGVKKVLSGKV